MANFSLVANSTFQPFSYQELAAPIIHQQQYLENLNEQYDKMSSQADVLEAMGKNDRDKGSGTYERYKSYSDSLREEADNLYRYGLQADSRMRLSDLRRRYSQEIVPIQNAWNKREQEADMQLKARMQNPTIMFTRDANNTSLDHYINNPTGGFGVISGANITAQVASMAKNLEKQVLRGEGKQYIDSVTYDYIKKYGLDENMINDWEKYPTLRNMVEGVLKSNGVTAEDLAGSSNANDIISRSTQFAVQGLWHGIGEDKGQLHNDPARMMALQEHYAIRRENRALAQQKELMALQNGTPAEGAPGDRGRLSFGDPAAAGTAARSELSDLTANFLNNYMSGTSGKGIGGMHRRALGRLISNVTKLSSNSGVEAINSALKELQKQDPNLMGNLKSYLRSNFSGDKDLVDMWLTHSNNGTGMSIRKSSEMLGSFGTRNAVWGNTSSREDAVHESWADFDKKAHTGYYITPTMYNDDQNVLGEQLNRTLTSQMHGDKLPIYELKGVDSASGRLKPGYNKLTLNDLPQDSSGNVQWNQIRKMDYGSDAILYWVKDGKPRQAVLRSEDMGLFASENRSRIAAAQRSNENLFRQGKISREEYNDNNRRLGQNMGQQDFGWMQPIKVPKYDAIKELGISTTSSPDYSEIMEELGLYNE